MQFYNLKYDYFNFGKYQLHLNKHSKAIFVISLDFPLKKLLAFVLDFNLGTMGFMPWVQCNCGKYCWG
jgi:hypothetical protein